MQQNLMYAYSAYCTRGLQDWSCFWCTYQSSDAPPLNVTLIFDNTTTSTYGYVGTSGTSVVVGFRGTNDYDLKNWMSDFEFKEESPYEDEPDVRVHSGFYNDYESVKVGIIEEVKGIWSKDKHTEVTVVGHSLGASLATFLVVDLAREGISKVKLVDFGSPRVGNRHFASYFKKLSEDSVRVVNQKDIVPHLPPREFRYHHVLREYWFPHNTTVFEACSDFESEDPKCSDSVHVKEWSSADHTEYLGYQQTDGHKHSCGN
eukprot:TRINITY_DN12724_c0_g1_i1.p1 TRINITY_DN12724_c0_g1~~TRINITY_DN12724_c0_g1_i1.p1  ORF type:complete len:302 (-),score=73.51 TRINITY_DN12724_c0_g1_i1:78-857(-)